MINLLLGAPGGGKSYEAVTYHVLPALKRGRKVITNLPLNLEAFEALDDEYPDLIELRTKTLAVAPASGSDGGEEGNALMGLIRQARASKFDSRAFANSEDFASEWKNADGMGPLYVIDECHFVMPRGGTQRAVEEWFSMHRHFNADVLLITQSSGKISAAIKDLVQVCYKVRKAIAFGKSDSYIRKVLDGVGGGEVSVQERKYKPQMFKLYRSHTQGVSLDEAQPDDVKPFIVKFRRMTQGVFLLGFFACFFVYWTATHKETPKPGPGGPWVNGKPAWMAAASAEYKALPAGAFAESPLSSASAPLSGSSAPVAANSGDDPEPYATKGLHMTGRITMGARVVYTFAVSQNALVVNNITDADLIKTGYKWKPQTDCAGVLIWNGKPTAVTCDIPQVSMGAMSPAAAGTVSKNL